MKRLSTTLILTAIWGFAQSADSPRPSAPDGEVAGHGYVDLGLPSGTLWATCNIEGDSPYSPGAYFAWGETRSRDLFEWPDYEFLEERHTDANGNDTYTATDIGKVISGTEYDAARSQWGDAWRIPTEDDWEELNEYCNMEYMDYSSIPSKKGLLISGPNGKRIFLSVTYCLRDLFPEAFRTAEYWTATASSNMAWEIYPAAQMITFSTNSSKLRIIPDSRHEGFAIRPVISRQDIGTSVSTLTDSILAMKYEDGIVTVSGHSEGCLLTVADLSGRCIRTVIVSDGKCRLSDLPKGIYLATLHNAGKTIRTLKISVK